MEWTRPENTRHSSRCCQVNHRRKTTNTLTSAVNSTVCSGRTSRVVFTLVNAHLFRFQESRFNRPPWFRGIGGPRSIIVGVSKKDHRHHCVFFHTESISSIAPWKNERVGSSGLRLFLARYYNYCTNVKSIRVHDHAIREQIMPWHRTHINEATIPCNQSIVKWTLGINRG